jgi:superoxide dismutase, Cu-Zn family
MRHTLFLPIFILGAFAFAGCHNRAVEAEAKTAPPIERAIAILTPTKGSQVKGMVDFKQNGEDVDIVLRLAGLEPNTVHGWHIHEFGDLSDPNGKATGGHYNPKNHAHALPNKTERHAGDLGNLTADAQGQANTELSVNNISINGELNPILGRGVIIHAAEDDGGQPTGNAGDRIAQGVIGVRQIDQPE